MSLTNYKIQPTLPKTTIYKSTSVILGLGVYNPYHWCQDIQPYDTNHIIFKCDIKHKKSVIMFSAVLFYTMLSFIIVKVIMVNNVVLSVIMPKAECRILYCYMLIDIMFSITFFIVEPNVIKLSVSILNVVILNVTMLSVIRLNGTFRDIMLSVFMMILSIVGLVLTIANISRLGLQISQNTHRESLGDIKYQHDFTT